MMRNTRTIALATSATLFAAGMITTACSFSFDPAEYPAPLIEGLDVLDEPDPPLPDGAECFDGRRRCDTDEMEVCVGGQWESDVRCRETCDDEAPVCGEMTEVPAGIFWRGPGQSDLNAESDEGFGTEVEVSRFFIDQQEVSVGDYLDCVDRGRCSFDALEFPDPGCLLPDPASPGENISDLPINCVGIDAAREYCAAFAKSLPTEAEWAKAARGGCEVHGETDVCEGEDAQIYPWGDDFNGSNAVALGASGPEPVDGKFAGRSPYGALNMIGNVAEFIDDPYVEGFFDTDASREPDPRATTPSGSQVVWQVRGGHYDSESESDLRISDRQPLPRAEWTGRNDPHYGFRCVYRP